MTCPICDSPGPFERFTDAGRLCPGCGLKVWVTDADEFFLWDVTSKVQIMVVVANRARLGLAPRAS